MKYLLFWCSDLAEYDCSVVIKFCYELEGERQEWSL